MEGDTEMKPDYVVEAKDPADKEAVECAKELTKELNAHPATALVDELMRILWRLEFEWGIFIDLNTAKVNVTKARHPADPIFLTEEEVHAKRMKMKYDSING